MKFRQAALLLIAALGLAACERPADSDAEATADNATEEESAEETAAIPVEVGTPTRADIYSTYFGTAPIEAFAEATVVAKVGGEVRRILVEEGDEVSAGQVLARLDGDRLRLSVEQAEANLNKLRRDFTRNRDLKDRGLLSEGDFEKIQYEMEAQEAAYNLAKLELSYTEIRAPIDGVIAERHVKVGNTIAVNDPLFEVTSLEPLVAYMHIPEREYRRVGKGMPALVQVDALGGQRFEGVVARISPVVDPETGTFKLTVEVSDAERRLKPGMFARIGIVSDVHADALQIPRAALVDEAGAPAVYVVKDGKAERREVALGYSQDGNIEITDGIVDGERVVVVGHTGLRDGSTVDVVGEDDADSAAVAATPSTGAEDS